MLDPTDVPDLLALSATQARVLGALWEKEATTPDAYPMTLNALTSACNQTSNRDPVVHFEPSHVETAALALKSKGLLRVVHPGTGERATKYRQVADEKLHLDSAARAVLCLLSLRGAETAAELRSRTERLHPFASPAAVETTLQQLASRAEPLVALVDRQPGQKEARWIQLLEIGAEARAAATNAAASTITPRSPAGAPQVDELERRVASLEVRFASLLAALGDLVDLDDVGGDDLSP